MELSHGNPAKEGGKLLMPSSVLHFVSQNRAQQDHNKRETDAEAAQEH